MRKQQIRTKPDGDFNHNLTLGGWLSGPTTYLWIGDRSQTCLGTISGQRLYRLAKAIVRHMESRPADPREERRE